MEEKGKTCPRSQKEGLNREAVEALRWFQTGCLSSAIPRHLLAKRQQEVCWSEVSQGSGRPVLEAARRHPQTRAAVRTSGIPLFYEVSETRWAVVARNPYLVWVGSFQRKRESSARLGRNDDGPANPQPGPGSSVPGHVVGSLTRLTRNSASLSVACW